MSNIPPNAWKFFAALSAFQENYAVIGGTATVFHLEDRIAQSQRATIDLDLAILEITTAPNQNGVWSILREFFTANNYQSQCLQNGKSQSFRFEAPESRRDLPSVIEIFSEEIVPNSERWVHRIADAELSAIVLPKAAIQLIAQHKITREVLGTPVSFASLSSLIVLKAIACNSLLQHPNPIEKAKHRKHISDIIRLAHTLRDGDELAVLPEIWPFLEKLIKTPEDYFLPQRIRDSLWADNPDINTRRAIKAYTPETFADILSTYFKMSQQPADQLT